MLADIDLPDSLELGALPGAGTDGGLLEGVRLQLVSLGACTAGRQTCWAQTRAT